MTNNKLSFLLVAIAVLSVHLLRAQLTPITLPWYENFENASGTFISNTTCVYCDSLVSFEFKTPYGGRLSFDYNYSNTSIGATDSVSATLHPLYSGNNISRILGTLNMTNYDTADVSSVMMTFFHFSQWDEPHLNDQVLIRGSKSDNWIHVYDLAQHSINGTWVKAEPLNITEILRSNGQNFSNEFQINFGEEDNDPNIMYDGRSIDDILIEEVSCVLPTSLRSKIMSDTSVIFEWNNYQPTDSIEVWIAEKGVISNSGKGGTYGLFSATDSLFVDTLSSSKCYEFSVRQICGQGDTSYWANPINFCTSCPLIKAPYFEDFNNSDTGLTGDLGNCWSTKEITNWTVPGTIYKFKIGKGYGPSTPNGPSTDAGPGYRHYVYAKTAGYSGDTAILELNTAIDISGLSSPELRFAYHMYGISYVNPLTVAIDDGSGWSNAETITSPHQNSITDSWKTVQIDLSSYSSPIKIRFYTTRNHNSKYVAIDNIAVDNVISCPSPTSLNLTSVDTSFATLTFSPGDSTNMVFQASYGVALQNPDLGTKVVFTGNMASLSGLLPSEGYCVYVRDICAPGDTSHWSEPVCFTTECFSYSAPYSQNFDNYIGPGLPPCWLAIGVTKDTSVALVQETDRGIPVASPPYSLEINDGLFPSMAIGPIFNDLGTGLNRIRFKMAYEGATTNLNDTLLVGTVNDNGDPTSFKKYTYLKGAIDSQFHEHIINFVDTGLIGSNRRIAFKYGPNYNIRFEYYLDDFYYEPVSNCPRPSELFEVDRSCTTIEVGWNSLYPTFIEYGQTGFKRGSGNLTGLVNSPYRVSNLLQTRQYDFYAYHICSGDTSVFYGPVKISTDSDAKPRAHFTIIPDSASNGISYITLDASTSFEGFFYQWDLGDGNFSSLSASPIAHASFKKNGFVTLRLIVQDKCYNTDTYSVNYNVYIDSEELDFLQPEVKVFPNPTNGEVNIKIDEAYFKGAVVYVTNTQGQAVLTEQRIEGVETKIKLPNLKALYFVNIKLSNGNVISRKIQVE